ncbi:MAG: hypothetical protein NC218_05765 [Acetobacter sp.]|nr:hypothetical protein [Acetobacter sp.]
MAEDDALDNFLMDNAQNTQVAGEEQAKAPRPKLKKIKRAKIRPTVDIPPAPEKVSPEITEDSSTVSVEMHNTLESPIEEKGTQPSSDTEENAAATSLITTTEVQNISATSANNPYVLDGLPPELDYIMDENVEDEYIADGGYVKKSIVYIAAFTCLFIGLFVGKIFFAEQKIENYGLEGVVPNPEVPAGRPRCGLTDKSQACVFYMLNWYKQELNGRDFYKLAAQLTGREEYMIESDNLRYSNVKIKPGHFAQLNIPAIK